MRIQFDYVNWKGEDHNYVVNVAGFEIQLAGYSGEDGARISMHAYPIMRDGLPRDSARRTFMAEKIRNLAIVP